jgi:hypothetical protein
VQSLLLEASLSQPPPLSVDESPPQSLPSSLGSSVDWLLPHASAPPEQPSAAAVPTPALDALELDDCAGCGEDPVGPEGGETGRGVVDDGDGGSSQIHS